MDELTIGHDEMMRVLQQLQVDTAQEAERLASKDQKYWNQYGGGADGAAIAEKWHRRAIALKRALIELGDASF